MKRFADIVAVIFGAICIVMIGFMIIPAVILLRLEVWQVAAFGFMLLFTLWRVSTHCA